jgi:hypothetical protein
MQNLPDKGVSRFAHYLPADSRFTGLTDSVSQSQANMAVTGGAISVLGQGRPRSTLDTLAQKQVPIRLGSSEYISLLAF